MQIIPTIKIGGIKYIVKVVPDEDFDGKTGAEIVANKKLIKVLKGDKDFMFQSFWHEIVHAINMELDEPMVEFLAQALYQIIVDNPKLFLDGGDKHGHN